jgi:hypothetical protein
MEEHITSWDDPAKISEEYRLYDTLEIHHRVTNFSLYLQLFF